MKKFVFFLVVLVLLTGCGGGGGGDSSSGGGGGAVSPENIGTYQGTAIIVATGNAGTVSQSLPMTVVVANDGRVSVAFNGLVSSTSCSGGSPIFISGNSFSDSATITCQDPQLGSCDVNATMNGNIANNAISGTGTYIYNCTAGSFTANISYTATKSVAAQSISALSNQQVGPSKISEVLVKAYLN